MQWHLNPKIPNAIEQLGFLPEFLRLGDGPAKKQLHRNYSHGGGWRPFQGFVMNDARTTLSYPGDPLTHWVARTNLGDEEVIIFQHAWVAVVAPDGSYEIARMD